MLVKFTNEISGVSLKPREFMKGNFILIWPTFLRLSIYILPVCFPGKGGVVFFLGHILILSKGSYKKYSFV